MKVFSKENVYDMALERFRFLFDEMPLVVSISGGKDSTVIFNMALEVAREKGKLPLKVFFLDQEAEWNSTVDTVRKIMSHPDVEPLWYQIPIRLQNATSMIENWLWCWKPEEQDLWLREKEEISIKENNYGTDRFHQMFGAILKRDFPEYSMIAGVRSEESPNRHIGLTEQLTYKWITWGKKLEEGQYTFYPIYDWSYTDVWKSIHDNSWDYNEIYDYQYRYGVSVKDMRVSNLHHETAVKSLFHLQEIDPVFYEKLTVRLAGIDTAGKMGYGNFFVKKLPFMFSNWVEYRDFLIEKLIHNNRWKKRLRYFSDQWDELLKDDILNREKSAKQVINSILANDFGLTKLHNYDVRFIGLYKKDKRRLEQLQHD